MSENCCHDSESATLNFSLGDIAVALSERCLAQNRYPREVVIEWLVLNPYAGAQFLLSTVTDAVSDALVEVEGQD